MVLTHVSCYCMTSFKYGHKTTKDVSLTYRCHLNNFMRDSIFYDSIGWDISCFCFLFFVLFFFFASFSYFLFVCCFFCKKETTVFVSMKERFSLIILTPWAWENLKL